MGVRHGLSMGHSRLKYATIAHLKYAKVTAMTLHLVGEIFDAHAAGQVPLFDRSPGFFPKACLAFIEPLCL